MTKSKDSGQKTRLAPIYLYDHLPELLFGYIALLIGVLALVSIPAQVDFAQWEMFSGVKEWGIFKWFNNLAPNEHLLFWIFSAASILFFVSYRWNLSKGRFLIVFGLVGTFLGIPAALELADVIHPYSWVGGKLGALAPAINAGAYAFISGVCFVIWFGSQIWSRMQLRAKLDESGLSITRADGTTERYELIGLKTTTSNFDYTEFVAGGIGSLTLSLRTGKEIFQLDRVFGLYWTPIFFWRRSKIDRINEMLSYQGKTTTVDIVDRMDGESADADHDGDHEDDAETDDGGFGDEFGASGDHESESSSEIK